MISKNGTGLLDAIPDDSLKAEYARQEKAGVKYGIQYGQRAYLYEVEAESGVLTAVIIQSTQNYIFQIHSR